MKELFIFLSALQDFLSLARLWQCLVLWCGACLGLLVDALASLGAPASQTDRGIAGDYEAPAAGRQVDRYI